MVCPSAVCATCCPWTAICCCVCRKYIMTKKLNRFQRHHKEQDHVGFFKKKHFSWLSSPFLPHVKYLAQLSDPSNQLCCVVCVCVCVDRGSGLPGSGQRWQLSGAAGWWSAGSGPAGPAPAQPAHPGSGSVQVGPTVSGGESTEKG